MVQEQEISAPLERLPLTISIPLVVAATVLLGKPIDQIVASGIAMSPEGRRVFADLTVVENLKIGAYLRKDKDETEKDLEWVYSLFPRLKERSWQSAGPLSGTGAELRQ